MPQRYTRPRKEHAGQPLSTVLRIAAAGGLPVLEDLLASQPHLIAAQSLGHGRSLLWTAVRHKRRSLVEFLVNRGADVNAPGRYARETAVLVSPFCLARMQSDTDLERYLIAHGATVDVYRAAFLGDNARVGELLDADPERVNAEDPADSVYYVPPLGYAVAGGHEDTVRLLLDRGARVDPYSRLLFDFAARTGHPNLARLLLAYGADPREAEISGYLDDPEIAELLLAGGADVNRPAYDQWPAIVVASRGDKGEHTERVGALLRYGALVDARGPRDRTALHCAAKAGFTSVITVLLEGGADINARMDDGTTPLGVARRAGRTEAAELLEANGAKE